ncbi:MAG: hypothetical protein IKD72_02480 [Clostridia bacterium]|nr:hypothetical protein [Clostridia bacterium]
MKEIEDLFAGLSPEDLAQLQSMAAGLFGGAEPQTAAPPPAQQTEPELDDLLNNAQMMGQVSRIMRAMRQEDSRTRLIAALKPLLSAPRRKRADEAIRLLRLMELLPMMTDGKGGGLFGA